MLWPPQVLIIARESSDRDKLEAICSASGAHPFSYSTLLEAQSFLSGQPVSAIFVEDPPPDSDFRTVLADVEREQKNIPVIALSRRVDWDSYLCSLNAGAFDCLALPPSTLEARRVLWSALQAFSTARSDELVVA
jgi:DNA-binding NtrC family response regulator